MKKSEVLTLLQSIQYPGFSRDIVSFGMVKNVDVSQDTVTIELTIKTKNDEKKQAVVDKIENKLSQYFKQVDIQIIDDGPRQGPSAQSPQSPVQQKFNLDHIKNVIAVASGKGGVGKSTVAANIALALKEKEFTVGLLDLDIYGPSLPIILGFNESPKMTQDRKIIPFDQYGLKVMSFGFISGNETPVIWRGPMVSRMTEQFFNDVTWGKLDFLILDLPPGTGDIHLTLTQKLRMAGAVIVTTPQDIALADVRKGADMFRKVHTPILGVIENMSGLQLKGTVETADGIAQKDLRMVFQGIDKEVTTDEKGNFSFLVDLFKSGGGAEESERLGVPLLGKIPISMDIMSATDGGKPIILSDPQSTVSEIFRDIAVNILSQLAN
ncbi:MAG TPA: MRP family ATP-binding protein [Candidatus Marinimicrobia bacterium]|nr:MRP family ATP-binding protein [Candidatus Neomarinimicrobiota bacterium]